MKRKTLVTKMKKKVFAFIALVALCLISCQYQDESSLASTRDATAPTGFTAKQVGNTIELTWNSEISAGYYEITNISTGRFDNTYSTSYFDEDPKEGLNDYKLRAICVVNAYGGTDWSEYVYASCYFEKNGSGSGD